MKECTLCHNELTLSEERAGACYPHTITCDSCRMKVRKFLEHLTQEERDELLK